MIDQLHWLGHSSFYYQGSKIVYFDPWEVSGQPKADVVLVSHDHHDHCSPDDVAKISKPDTVIVTEPKAAGRLSGDVRVMAPGQSLEANGIKVTALPSYNQDKQFHPRANAWLGFIAEIDGVKIYHTGDSDLIPEMEGLEVDIALIPVSGTYVMDADQAVEAARAIRPKIAVPMHYGRIVGSEEDAKKFEAALKDEIRVVVKTKE